MARISLLDEKDRPEEGELIEKIRRGRRGSLINLYRSLLHSPPLAGAWLEHMNAVRWQTGLSGRLRELLIIRIAHLNHAQYVLVQHIPALAAADGVSLAECEALADWRGTALFDAGERAALAYADAMTKDITVPDAVFAELKRHYDQRKIVELTVLIGTYNMHTRFVIALEIDPERPA